jgi:hypothetical protein
MKTKGQLRIPGHRARLTALALFCMLTACAPAELPEAEPEQGRTDPAEVAMPDRCCVGGAFYCERDPSIVIDYDPPRCGMYTRPRAMRVCAAQCSAPCIDTGASNHCE